MSTTFPLPCFSQPSEGIILSLGLKGDFLSDPVLTCLKSHKGEYLHQRIEERKTTTSPTITGTTCTSTVSLTS